MTESDRVHRDRFTRIVLSLAALYNLAFGAWAVLSPLSFYTLFGLAAPNHPAVWRCLGMVIGVYGAGYAWASIRPDLVKPIVALGLAGKILGPIGWVATVASGEWPMNTFTLILFNDLVWWLPFGLILLEGTRVGERIRALAPQACAVINATAAFAMLIFLRPGMEVGGDSAARFAYISGHPVAWRAGWGIWIAAALSLVAFYAWWGARLGLPRRAIAAFFLVTAGLAGDLFAESLYIAWLPERLETAGRLGTLLTGGAANGLYTVAGILLTLMTPMTRGMRVAAAAVWTSGVGVTLFTLLEWLPGLVASTAALMILFPPWTWMLGRRLR